MVAEVPKQGPVRLSLLKSAFLEHLEGESLFSSIAAGRVGRFDCEKLLKPAGIDLLDLPQNAHIEVTVSRRRSVGSEMQKQLLYRAMISLALARAMSPQSQGDGEHEPQLAFEAWLALVPIESPVNHLSPDLFFQKCLEMGMASNQPSPRLLVSLHGPLAQSALTRRHPDGQKLRSQSYVPQVPASLGGLGTAWQGSNPEKELEALRLRSQSLEKQNEALKEKLRQGQESKELTQVRWLLAKHGWHIPVGESTDPTEQVVNVLTEILQGQERLRDKAAGLRAFYKPLRSDPVDCLLAAELLRSGLSTECHRLAPGQYELGETAVRLSCYIESGRLMAQLQAEDQPLAAMEFGQVLSNLRAGAHVG